jgi:hypothetical protein
MSIEDITTDPYFPLITFIIGIILSLFLYNKSKRSKSLKYVIRTNNLFKDHTSKLTGLEVKYKTESVKDLSVSKLMFWNSGKVTIEGKDNTEAEPLAICMDGDAKILEASIIKENNSASRIELFENEQNSYTLKFDYLDGLDGAVINIVHTGLDSEGITLKGKIKGIKKIKKSSIPKAPQRIHLLVPIPIEISIAKYTAKKRRVLYGLSHISIGILWALIASVGKFLEKTFPDNAFFNSDGNTEIPVWIVVIPAALFVLNGLYIIVKKIPQDIDLYEDE